MRKHLFITTCIEKQCTRPLISGTDFRAWPYWVSVEFFSSIERSLVDGSCFLKTNNRNMKEKFIKRTKIGQ